MIPGNHADTRAKKKLPRPPSGLRGWPGAWAHLERLGNDEQREVLTDLARQGGMQGPALAHLAAMLIHKAGLGLWPARIPRGLTGADVTLIERRAEQLLRDHMDVFPKQRPRGH